MLYILVVQHLLTWIFFANKKYIRIFSNLKFEFLKWPRMDEQP